MPTMLAQAVCAPYRTQAARAWHSGAMIGASLKGLSEDGTHLLVVTDAGEEVRVAVTDELRAMVRHARITIRDETPAASGMPPREIQQRIRAGLSAAELAHLTGEADVVHFAGFVTETELVEWLHRATVVVIPSLYEPFGIVALEGMAAGAPTIVARTGGLAEIVENTGAGALFEPGNHIALANCIADVLNHPDVAESLRTNAASLLASRYTWDAIAATTLGIYNKAKRG